MWLGVDQASCDKSHCVRGSAQYFFDEGVVCRHVPRTESDTWRLHILKKALVWAREIAAHEAGGCPSCDHCRFLSKKLGRLPLKKVCPLLHPSLPLCAEWRDKIDQEIASINSDATKRRMAWKVKMQDSARKGSRDVYTWLKHGATTLGVVSHLGSFHVHPPSILSAIFQQWHEVFCPDQHALQETTVEAALACMPSKHLDLPDLCCEDFANSVKLRSESSAGLDGIQLSELRSLPTEAWQLIVTMIGHIETGAPWPYQLLEVRLAPIPKGDGEGVIACSKVRLVSVSSHVYRSWSWIRTKQASSWIESITPKEIYGGVKGRSTFDVVATATTMWQQAVFQDEELGQLSLDTSKCFDTLSHSTLLRLSAHMGLPLVVRRPFEAFVTRHRRVLALRNWAGPEIVPVRGLPQ
eukprot:4238648-Amphidinium_carterae.1